MELECSQAAFLDIPSNKPQANLFGCAFPVLGASFPSISRGMALGPLHQPGVLSPFAHITLGGLSHTASHHVRLF